MDVLVVARLIPSGRDAARIETHGDSISAGHEQCRFNRIFGITTATEQLYHKVCRPLVKSFTRGFNTCLYLLDQSDDQNASATLTGSGDQGDGGLIQFLVHDLFALISDEQTFLMTVASFEVFAEQVRDLLAPDAKDLRLVETPQQGWTVRDISTTQVRNASACVSAFKTAYSERLHDPTKRQRSCFVFHINFSQGDVQAWCRIVVPPVADAIVADQTRARLTHGSHVVQGPGALSTFISTLASKDERHQLPDAVDASAMTRLLGETLGHNCQAAVIAHMREEHKPTLPSYLRLCNQLRKIRTFPVLNQSSLRGLVESFRSAVLALKNSTSGLLRDMGLSSGEEHDVETKLVESNLEILKLKDMNAKLNDRLQTAKSRHTGAQQQIKSLNEELLNSEEERLLLTRALLQMQRDHTQQEMAAEKQAQEDATRISSLEEDLDAAVAKQSELQQTISELKDHAAAVEGELEGRIREINSLKGGTLALDEEFSIQLRAKIATLVKAQIKIIRERDALTQQIVALEGHPQDSKAYKKATEAAVRSTKDQGDEVANMILRRTRVESKEGKAELERLKLSSAAKSTDATMAKSQARATANANATAAGAGSNRRIAELEQELAIAREETEQLQKENKRMASTHDAFIRDHRKRLENHVQEFAALSSKRNKGQRAVETIVETVEDALKDHSDLFQQETAELQARLVSVEEQLQRKTLRLRRLLGVYRNLRCMCEDNDLPVPRSDRFEEAELDEPAEIARLRKALRDMHSISTALHSGSSSSNTSSNSNLSLESINAFTSKIQRRLEDERSQLLVSMARAEQKIKVMEEFIRAKLKGRGKKARK